MSFSRLSMQKKLVLSILPTVGVIAVVSTYIYGTGVRKNADLERAVRMGELVQRQELEMVKMSEALRGYLLNPADKTEFERKKAADDAYGKAADELVGMTSDVPEIQKLAKELATFDATTLNEKEDAVGKLIDEHSTTAAAYYSHEYMPARRIQNENFAKMKSLVNTHAAAIIAQVDTDKRTAAYSTILLLWCGALVGVGVTFWVTIALTRSANRVFDRINVLTGELADTSRALSGDSARLSDAASEEASAIQETATATDQVSAMITRNSENAARSLEVSTKSRLAADAGRASVESMIRATAAITDSNDMIMRQVEAGNKQIGEITKVIAEIGDKTKVINDIVFQTKLLSFNASVEAARAGEHGKGFSVVAEEVGNLAQMSGNAAKEISGMLDASIAKVEGIIKETRSSVERLVVEGRRCVADGAGIAEGCGTALQSIATSVSSLDGMIAEINSASREQASGVAEISKAMGSLDQVTHQNSLIAQQSAAAARRLEEQSAALSGLLGELVGLFRGRAKDEAQLAPLAALHEPNTAAADQLIRRAA